LEKAHLEKVLQLPPNQYWQIERQTGSVVAAKLVGVRVACFHHAKEQESGQLESGKG